MYLFALDSTAVSASVALCSDEALLGEILIENGNTHSENLLPMAEDLLKKFKLTPRDIDLFACTAGPGSFTGVRIGVATVKGLAFGTEKPCIGVSTLASLARNLVGFGAGHENGIIVSPVMNARRSQVYNALFRIKDGEPERLTPDRALSISELEAELLTYDAPVYLCGDGYDVTKTGFRTLVPNETPIRLRMQSGYSTAVEALRLYESGVRTTDRELVPVYLRPCQAERERMEKEAVKQNSAV